MNKISALNIFLQDEQNMSCKVTLIYSKSLNFPANGVDTVPFLIFCMQIQVVHQKA